MCHHTHEYCYLQNTIISKFLLWLSCECLTYGLNFVSFQDLRLHILWQCMIALWCLHPDISTELAATGKIKKQRPSTTCEVTEQDLARLHSITEFAADFKHRHKWDLQQYASVGISYVVQKNVSCIVLLLPFWDPLRHWNCCLSSMSGSRGKSEKNSKRSDFV
jgi:hypothetical protein